MLPKDMSMYILQTPANSSKVDGMCLSLGCCLVDALLQNDTLQPAGLAITTLGHSLLYSCCQRLLGRVCLHVTDCPSLATSVAAPKSVVTRLRLASATQLHEQASMWCKHGGDRYYQGATSVNQSKDCLEQQKWQTFLNRCNIYNSHAYRLQHH